MHLGANVAESRMDTGIPACSMLIKLRRNDTAAEHAVSKNSIGNVTPVLVQQLRRCSTRAGAMIHLAGLHQAGARFHAVRIDMRGVGPRLRTSMNCPLRIR